MTRKIEPTFDKDSMRGKTITISQSGLIKKISELLNVHFFGQDRFDASEFISTYLDEYKYRKAKPKTVDTAVQCASCAQPIREDKVYSNVITNEYMCTECYEESSPSICGLEEDTTAPFTTKSAPTATTTSINPKKRGNKMFNNMKSIIGDFGKVTSDEFKLSFQGVAIRTSITKADSHTTESDATYAVYDAAHNRMIDVMDFVLDVDNVFYKVPAQLADLVQGDIIIAKGKPLVVKSINTEAFSIRALNPVTNNETTYKPAGNLFGFQFITKVVSMFDMMQGGNGQPMNPMMLMLMTGDKDDKMSDLMPLMLMGGMGAPGVAGANPMQSMLPFLLMSKQNNGDSNMMEMMLMSQMFGGGMGGFPIQGQPFQQGNGFPFFGGAQAPMRQEEELVEDIPTEEPTEEKSSKKNAK